jgi:predicted nuclease with TOPRIM domain
MAELHRAEDELERFFSTAFARLQSLTGDLVQREQAARAAARRQAEDSRAVADCRRQFRACLQELQEVQADARDAREETRRVWADVRAAQEQALRHFAQLGETHATLLGEIERVRALLERSETRGCKAEIRNRPGVPKLQ